MNHLTTSRLDQFIRERVTRRERSFLEEDMERFRLEMSGEVKGRSVLVIGGAGSIGKAFIKEILAFQPDRLVVVDWNENGLTELTRDLRSQASLAVPRHYTTYPFDFGGFVFERFFRQEGPFDIVAHFAAHKHVRTEKDRYAIEIMVRNNLFSTVKLMQLLSETPPRHFFAVSTDKAAAPASVMGAAKKLMEEAILVYSMRVKASTARFANVAFSNGSLPDGFLHRLRHRQPLAAPEGILRYFVSPVEAGQLCLLATLTSQAGDILFPKIKRQELLSFTRIAEDLLEYLQLKPDYCNTEQEAREKARSWTPGRPYPVYFFPSGTSGEKPEEIFFTESEPVDLNRYTNLGVIRRPARFQPEKLQDCLDALEALFDRPQLTKADLVGVLEQWIPDFRHLETGKKLDNQM